MNSFIYMYVKLIKKIVIRGELNIVITATTYSNIAS